MNQEEKKDPSDKNTQPASPEGNSGGIMGWIETLPTRSSVIMVIAGAYLIYLGYGLIKDTAAGAEGSSIGFGIAGGAFAVIGVLMLAVAGIKFSIVSKEKKETDTTAEPEETEVKENPQDPPRKMSISQRASLADRIDEEEENS